MPPLVSVVMPVHDGEAHLAEAIESVLAQTYRPLELIVVDDGSSDGSAEVAARYADGELELLRQRNAGTGAARNAGLQRARGELIAHLDADDVWLSHKLELQAEALSRDARADIASGLIEEFLSPELSHAERRRMRAPRGPIPGAVVQTLLVRRSEHERVGAFETAWQVGQDLAWLMRAQELGLRFLQLPVLVARRRLHATNKGRRSGALGAQRCLIIKQALDRRRASADARES